MLLIIKRRKIIWWYKMAILILPPESRVCNQNRLGFKGNLDYLIDFLSNEELFVHIDGYCCGFHGRGAK